MKHALNTGIFIFTLAQLKVNVMFLCFFPFSLMMISNVPQFCSFTTLCFVSSVHQWDQSLRLEGTGPAPCEDWVINLQITGKFKYKVWNFLQTPHTYTFYRYFWMGWIVLGDFLFSFLRPIQVSKLRCLVPLQITEQLPPKFWKCWVSKSPVWTSQIIWESIVALKV